MKRVIEEKKAVSLLMAIALLFGNTIVRHTIYCIRGSNRLWSQQSKSGNANKGCN